MNRKKRLREAYRIVHGTARSPGAVEWFRSEIQSNHSRSAVYRWFDGENVVDGHVLEVALHTLEGKAMGVRLARAENELAEIREGLR